jgi:Terminase large subunit gpA, endonuclease domain
MPSVDELRERHRQLGQKIREAERLAGDGRYARHRADAAERSRARSLAGREIGPLPEVADPARKEAARTSYRFFCLSYFPKTFFLPFSADHLKAIAKIEMVVLEGGLFALAMARGSGKTTLAEIAAIWALLFGHRAFVVLIGADLGRALSMLESIKSELENNELLAADFPEVCYPVARLERIANRCKGQLHKGEPTDITWNQDKVVFPTVRGSRASGGVIQVGGLTGTLRGLKHKLPNGHSIRPDLVIPDDPQTDESARSASQCACRERLLAGAVLGMAGPKTQISGLMPCTVIAPGDLADRMLDTKLHPEWNGERCKMVYTFPTRDDLWQRYAEIRRESLRAEHGGAEATEFYRANREAMDAGAVVAWPENYRPGELSALQYAMNLRMDDEAAFMAERQNDPLPLIAAEAGELKADEVAARVNRCPRSTCPAGSTRLTAFIDIQQDLLFWVVAAWSEGFGGCVVDYGTFPDQRRPYFGLRDANPTLAQATKVTSLEGSIYAGLGALAGQLLGREWPLAAGGGALRVEKCLIDSGWGMSTEVIHRFCRQSAHAALLAPSKGMGITAAMTPIHEWQKKPGERRGNNWVIPVPTPGQGRRVLYDANTWKSFVAARLRQPMGEAGALTLFGDEAVTHRLFADHITAEYAVKTLGRGRQVEEWKSRPNRENHWLDALVGCAVGASILGVTVAGVPPEKPRVRKRVSLREMQEKARARRYG